MKKIAKVKPRNSKSGSATKAVAKAKKKIKPANTYLTESHPELPRSKRNSGPRA